MKNRHKLSYKQMMYKLVLWRYEHCNWENDIHLGYELNYIDFKLKENK